jgi:hypothetical protein
MEKDDKKKKTSATKKADSTVINTNPQLPGVNEQGFAVANKDPIAEKVLSLTQRRQRSIQMRKIQPRLARGRKIAKTRMASADRLRMRADMVARNIARRRFAGERGAEYQTLSPSDKIAVDKLIDKKVQLIKRMADRLLPRVKAAEVKRLQAARSGHGAVKTGSLAAGPLFQSMEFRGLVDALLTEQYNEKMEKLLRLGLGDKDKLNQFRQALKNPEQAGKYSVLRKHLLTMLDKLSDLVTDDPTVFQKSKAKLQKERDYREKKESDKVEESLIRKSQKSGVPFEILAEVYNRGYASWNEGMKHDAEQNAFHRVNSYISGGKARELDSDLIEADVWDKPNPVQKSGKSSKLSPKAKSKARARARAAGRPYPNMVDNIWAARNEGVIGDAVRNAAAQTLTKNMGTLGAAIAAKITKKKKTNEATTPIETNPKLSKKSVNREIYTINRKSMDPMSEGSDDPTKRFEGTNSLVKTYSDDTPGQKKVIKKLKEVTVAGFAGKKIEVANQKIRMADGTIKSKPPGKSGSSGSGGAGGDGGGE